MLSRLFWEQLIQPPNAQPEFFQSNRFFSPVNLRSDLMRLSRAVTVGVALLLSASASFAEHERDGGNGIGPIIFSVPQANKREGTPPSISAFGFKFKLLVSKEFPLENPSGEITSFGELSTGVGTEPDQNTYVVFNHNPGGADKHYDYGRHFLFQGHENGANLAYVTRINLDVKDKAHKITLLTPTAADGLTHFSFIDGSTYNPFTKTLLFTQENGAAGGVIEITPSWPPVVRTLDGIIGKAGYEGIHPDDRGNLMIVEDTGGTSVSIDPNDPAGTIKVAKQPNSFVFRFIPRNKRDLSKGGKLQALQVSIDGAPLVFNPTDAFGDTHSELQLKLHTPGTSYPVQWVTVHDTEVDGTDPFDANALAKAVGATPFKRPENASFLPGSDFQTFFFAPTGDTNADAGAVPSLAARGAWGSVFRVDLHSNRETGQISLFYLGDADHASFDNLTFADDRTLLATEDRGDLLHTQLNKLDSVWAFAIHGFPRKPVRLVALGRDATSVTKGEDNEPTGVFVSGGRESERTIPGAESDLFNVRAFLTRQHGDNVIWEIVETF
jgi:hypothetical protein